LDGVKVCAVRLTVFEAIDEEQFALIAVMSAVVVALSATSLKVVGEELPLFEVNGVVVNCPPGRDELEGPPYSESASRNKTVAAEPQTIGQKKKGKPRLLTPAVAIPGYPLPYVLVPKTLLRVAPPAALPAKGCPLGIVIGFPPPLPYTVAEDRPPVEGPELMGTGLVRPPLLPLDEPPDDPPLPPLDEPPPELPPRPPPPPPFLFTSFLLVIRGMCI